jgi:mono/diheme cytochrome c family protein
MQILIVLSGVLAIAAGCKKQDEAPAKAEPPPASQAKTVEPSKPAETPAASKLVERGAYVAAAAGCAVCHTAIGPNGPDLEHAFGGGLEMPDATGTWRTPNITPDKSTGIGNWTDEQIARAIRQGERPDGSGLYAIMPFMNFAVMSDDDVAALVAFLRTVKPVDRVVAPNLGLHVMKGPAPDADRFAAARAAHDEKSEDAVKRGAYFASIMLCGHCHWTPSKNAGPAPDKMFSGGFPFNIPMLGSGTLYAANITSDAENGIGKWTEDQIFTTLKTMVRPDGRTIQGPMLFLQAGWSRLDDKDLHAVAAYIHQLPPVKNKVPVSTFKANPPPPGAAATAH